MKKFFVALVCTILATGAAMAQKAFTFGPKVGVDFTHLWDADGDYGGVLNYQAGLFMEYRFTDRVSIAPEVVFAAQGAKHKWVVDNNEISTTYHLNYINIPVMFKFYIAPALSIDFGPQLGVNVYHKSTDKRKLMGKDYKDDAKEVKDVKSVDVGLGLGLTYNITDEVLVQGRYTLGLTKVAEGYDSKNGNAQIAIGFRF